MGFRGALLRWVRTAAGWTSPSRGAALICLTGTLLAVSPGTSSAALGQAGASVLFVGDSNALSVFAAVRDRPGRGWSVAIATRFGCGVLPYTAVADGVVLTPAQPLCSDWERARAGEISAQPADVALLFAGGWEQYDRWFRGRAIPYTSQRWMRLTVRDYARALREMRGSAKLIGVVLNGCHHVPDTDLPIETMYQAGRYAPVINDERRVQATNRAIRAAARSVEFRVYVLDLHSFLCSEGYTDTKDGTALRTDGLHFTPEGSRLIWTWMKREIAGW